VVGESYALGYQAGLDAAREAALTAIEALEP
jgi:hypothetical protein